MHTHSVVLGFAPANYDGSTIGEKIIPLDFSGSNQSELYGKYTWKIAKYSEINEDSFRSGSFHVGGYEWYILIHPQRRDVDNHLSLHLCVANHKKLCPGWSNFVQFTIALVNKDPKKSIYTDTIHLFGKIEYNVQKKTRTVAHNWGWDMFIESPKLQEGYIDDLDSLIIKAQVQVIREEVDRPFRCLSSQYRRELVRVYLPTVEYNCGQFMRDKIISFGRLIQDKENWQSFRSFWSRLDQNTRRKMSRDKMDVVLNLAAKIFFVMKQGATTLMMDSLYSGWKAIEGQTKTKDNVEFPDGPASIVSVDQDMFVLEDDLLSLMQKTVMAPFPINEEKVSFTCYVLRNDEEEYNKEAIMRDESRLTEVGRQTMEILALAHIYGNRVDVAYKEHMALKRQEQLIREEEEEKAKRGTTEKKTKSKKKQAKKKKNKKEKGEEDKVDTEKEESVRAETESSAEKPDTLGDNSPVECELDASEIKHSPSGGRSSSIYLPSGGRGRGSSISLPNESARSGVGKGKVLNFQSKIWRRKEKTQPRKASGANSLATETEDQPSRHPSNPKSQSHSSESRRVGEADVVKTLKPREHNPVSKDRGTVQTQEKSPAVFSPLKASPLNFPSVAQAKPEKRDVFSVDTIPNKKPIPAGPPLLDQASPSRDIQFRTYTTRFTISGNRINESRHHTSSAYAIAKSVTRPLNKDAN
ncbi:unnamed protein product [Eruca vesicaria subsp. sativa]|uniref:MATH domain-containing protein n=1 Tax=Eruca vesicaria subsp. sativa TaxID=29727 RepID=A0ABC8JDN8_ERUVS|nr:unnamed protein product [Eruca vesicaria subsp. sativa]